MTTPEGDIRFSVKGEDYIIGDGTYAKAQEEFLPLCKMCTKSPMTCDNEFIKEVQLPMEPNDDPALEVRHSERLPSGEMSEKIGTGFKIVNGVKAGIYTSEDDLPTVFICEQFIPLKV